MRLDESLGKDTSSMASDRKYFIIYVSPCLAYLCILGLYDYIYMWLNLF